MARPKTIMLVTAAVMALVLGCSEGQVSLPEDDAGGDMASNGDMAGGDTGNNNGDTNTTGNDTNTGSCINGDTRCSAAGHVETCTNQMWTQTQMCSAGCAGGMCTAEPVFGDCQSPTPISPGQTITSTTDTLYNPNTWSQDCTESYGQQTSAFEAPVGAETVFALTVTQSQMLRLTLDPQDPTFFALYIRSECTNPGTEVAGMCGGSAAPGADYVTEGYFAPGTYFIFVDSFADSPPGVFSLTVEQTLLEACGDQIPVPIDVSSGSATVSGDTDQGKSVEDWLSGECEGNSFETKGRENIYVFGLAEQKQVNIDVDATDPTDSQMGVYIRTDCEDRYDQVACGHGAGQANINTTLKAGTYYLFVDDFIGSIDETQTYDLTITAN